jgi:hypothetical protein
MYRCAALAFTLILLGSIGCASGPGRKCLKKPVRASVMRQAELLVPDKPLLTSDVIHIKVTIDDIEWTACAGPNPGQAGPAELTLTRDPSPALLIIRGWVYISGKWPTGKSERVTAGGTGTTILVQHEGPAGGGTHRAFYWTGNWPTKVLATLDQKPATTKALTSAGSYFEVGPGNVDLPPATSVNDAPPNVAALIEHVKNVVPAPDPG